MTRLRKVITIGLVNLAIVALLFAVLEGTASILSVGSEIIHTPAVPEHRHAEHDETLGWVNLPNAHLPDAYGPGVGVQTNAQRFRNRHDFTRAVPAGKMRIVCSGDSFTFGYGVDNDQTWCQRLAALDPRLETVNMGLGGYGVDQAYLWYMRDGTDLDHDLQLFVFLTDDFNRMRFDRFMGYGKPLLSVRDDSLVITNYPVPRTSWFTRRRALHGETLTRLNVVRLSRKLLRLDDHARAAERAARDRQRLREIVARIFADLRRANDARQSRLVLVYLPGEWDYKSDPTTDEWRQFVLTEAARQKLRFLDLVDEIRRVPPTEIEGLYAPNHHFTVAGNQWAAKVIHGRLASLLDTLASSTPSGAAHSR
jgi:lysophospholipase L1-like esterase